MAIFYLKTRPCLGRKGGKLWTALVVGEPADTKMVAIKISLITGNRRGWLIRASRGTTLLNLII